MQFSLRAETEVERFRLLMYLDLGVFLFSPVQSINVFLHPLLFTGMGDTQFASVLCHKAGEEEDKDRIRKSTKKFLPQEPSPEGWKMLMFEPYTVALMSQPVPAS